MGWSEVGHPNPRAAPPSGAEALAALSKPGEWREATGPRGQWELARRASARDRRGARVRTGLAGSKAGQGELNEATRSPRGQGPWYPRAGLGDSSGGLRSREDARRSLSSERVDGLGRL